MSRIYQFNYTLDTYDIERSNLDLMKIRDQAAIHALAEKLMEVVRGNDLPTMVQYQRDQWREYGMKGPGLFVSHRFRATKVRCLDATIPEPPPPIPMVEYRTITVEKPAPPTWWQRLKNGVADAWKEADQLSGCGVTKPEAV